MGQTLNSTKMEVKKIVPVSKRESKPRRIHIRVDLGFTHTPGRFEHNLSLYLSFSERYIHWIYLINWIWLFQEELQSCARTVLLTLPPDDVKDLGLTPNQLGDTWRSLFSDVIRIPHMRVLIEYNSGESLFVNSVPPWGSIKTDLPLSEVHVVDNICEPVENIETVTFPDVTDLYGDSSTVSVTATEYLTPEQQQCSTIIQVNIYGDHLAYWTHLLEADGYNVPNGDYTNVDLTSSTFGCQMRRYLEELLRTNSSMRILDTDAMSMRAKLWSKEVSTPAFNIWKPGVNWDDISKRMRRPMEDVRLYLVGSAYSPSYLQYWAEGAMMSVDKLLSELAFIFHWVITRLTIIIGI